MYDEIKLLKFKSSSDKKFGHDDFYVYKNELNILYPEYMVEVTKFYDAKNPEELTLWVPIKSALLGY